jgi:prepilin-type N-terminal cleavage/methylation domain-containing protein
MKLNPQIKAFTLVELLVVITIIATLAGIAFPVYNQVQEKGKQTKALAAAKQIGLACKIYASDYDGAFPKYKDTATPSTGDPDDNPSTANQVYQSLIAGGYVPDESIFFTQGSGYSTKTPNNNKTIDNGENNYGYVWGLSDTDTPAFPLVADGWVAGKPGEYTADSTAPGGVWKGKKAIVIRVDMSGKVENLNAAKVVFGPTINNNKGNIFTKVSGADGEAGWLTNAKFLEPVAVAATP